jgi:hypothetical protein
MVPNMFSKILSLIYIYNIYIMEAYIPTIPQLLLYLPAGPNCPKAIVDLYNSRTGSSWAAAV